jgi:hypothetical protein
MNGKSLSSFLEKSCKNVPLLQTAQAAKNILNLPFTTDFIRRKKLTAHIVLKPE